MRANFLKEGKFPERERISWEIFFAQMSKITTLSLIHTPNFIYTYIYLNLIGSIYSNNSYLTLHLMVIKT